MKKKQLLRLIILFLLSGSNVLKAQTLIIPEASQAAKVMQRIGITDINISYHSPLAKNRKIWDALVPYDQVWRAGANENTTISFSTDVKIEGHELAAGTYGLHMIPTKEEWTIIFSKNSSSWGSFFYDETEDALRVKAIPVSVDYQDWLAYYFTDIQNNSCKVNLRWEKLSIGFNVKVDVEETVYNSMREELRGIDAFTWEAPLQAARYCLSNDIHLDQGKKWLEQSMRTQQNSTNSFTMAKYLSKEGKSKEAAEMTEKAKTLANEAELNTYGYTLLFEKNIPEAIEVFNLNVKRHPDSWNVYDSLGEAYDMNGNKKEALKNYLTALAKSPENQKARIEPIIKKLQGN